MTKAVGDAGKTSCAEPIFPADMNVLVKIGARRRVAVPCFVLLRYPEFSAHQE